MVNYKSYLDKISIGLSHSPDVQKKAIEDLKSSLDDYLQDHPTASKQDIYKRFGSPEEVIQNYIGKTTTTNKKRASKLKYWAIAIAAVAILAVAGYFLVEYIIGNQANEGYAEKSIEQLPAMIHALIS